MLEKVLFVYIWCVRKFYKHILFLDYNWIILFLTLPLGRKKPLMPCLLLNRIKNWSNCYHTETNLHFAYCTHVIGSDLRASATAS